MYDFHDVYFNKRDSLEWKFRKKFLNQKCPKFIGNSELTTSFGIDVLSHVKSPNFANESIDEFTIFIVNLFEGYENESWYIKKFFKNFRHQIYEILNLARSKEHKEYLKKRNAAVEMQTKVCAYCDKKHECGKKADNDDMVTFYRAIDGLLVGR